MTSIVRETQFQQYVTSCRIRQALQNRSRLPSRVLVSYTRRRVKCGHRILRSSRGKCRQIKLYFFSQQLQQNCCHQNSQADHLSYDFQFIKIAFNFPLPTFYFQLQTSSWFIRASGPTGHMMPYPPVSGVNLPKDPQTVRDSVLTLL
jgi:hypothetical protein